MLFLHFCSENGVLLKIRATVIDNTEDWGSPPISGPVPINYPEAVIQPAHYCISPISSVCSFVIHPFTLTDRWPVDSELYIEAGLERAGGHQSSSRYTISRVFHSIGPRRQLSHIAVWSCKGGFCCGWATFSTSPFDFRYRVTAPPCAPNTWEIERPEITQLGSENVVAERWQTSHGHRCN